MTATDSRKDALKDVTVLNEEPQKFGLPAKYFWLGVGMTLALCAVYRSFWWVVGPLFCFVYFQAAYAMHDGDPKGAEGWMRAFRRPTHWSGGTTKSRRFLILDESDPS